MWPETASGATLTMWASTKASSVSECDRREPIQLKRIAAPTRATATEAAIQSPRGNRPVRVAGKSAAEGGGLEGLDSRGGSGSEGGVVMGSPPGCPGPIVLHGPDEPDR